MERETQKPEIWTLWLDLETTGVDPRRDGILEAAVVLTRGETMEIVAEKSWLVAPEGVDDLEKDLIPEVLAIHRASGLLDEWMAAWSTRRGISFDWAVDREICALLREWVPDPRVVRLAGYSVHFDREFMSGSELRGMISHRIIDVSTIRGLVPEQDRPKQAKAHRALADCHAARAELLGYLTRLRGAPSTPAVLASPRALEPMVPVTGAELAQLDERVRATRACSEAVLRVTTAEQCDQPDVAWSVRHVEPNSNTRVVSDVDVLRLVHSLAIARARIETLEMQLSHYREHARPVCGA